MFPISTLTDELLVHGLGALTSLEQGSFSFPCLLGVTCQIRHLDVVIDD